MILQGSDFIASASRLGVLMGGQEELTETAKRMLEEEVLVSIGWAAPSFRGNKYTEKGWLVEDDAIKDYCSFTGQDGKKNEEKFANDWVKGYPDLILNNKVVDIKAPWSKKTYDKAVNYKGNMVCPSSTYYWQLQAYMWLTGRNHAELAYVLMDIPFELLEEDDVWVDYECEIPLDERIKVFAFDRDDEAIEKVKTKVAMAREHIDNVVLPRYMQG